MRIHVQEFLVKQNIEAIAKSRGMVDPARSRAKSAKVLKNGTWFISIIPERTMRLNRRNAWRT